MTELRKVWVADETTGRTAHLDETTDAMVVIPYSHHETHEGSQFEAQVFTAAGTAISLAFKTPAGTKKAHVVWEFDSESKVHFEVIEGASWTTNTGTVITPTNQNRSSGNTSILLEDKTATPAWTANGILQNPTGVSGGTVVNVIYSFASKQVGATGGIRLEHVLAPDETYVFRLTSDDGSKGMQVRLYWYEHTDAS